MHRSSHTSGDGGHFCFGMHIPNSFLKKLSIHLQPDIQVEFVSEQVVLILLQVSGQDGIQSVFSSFNPHIIGSGGQKSSGTQGPVAFL